MIKDNNVREAIITRGVDGDSIIVNLVTLRYDKEEFESDNGTEIRLAIIDTPERKHEGYQEATDFTKTFVGQTVQVQVYKKEKYGRILADVYVMVDGEQISLSQLLLLKGLAKVFGK